MGFNMYIIFSNVNTANAFSNSVDIALGYPKTGEDIGGGIHVPSNLKVIPHFSVPLKHPTQNEWAFFINGIENMIPNGMTPIALTEDWYN